MDASSGPLTSLFKPYELVYGGVSTDRGPVALVEATHKCPESDEFIAQGITLTGRPVRVIWTHFCAFDGINLKWDNPCKTVLIKNNIMERDR